MAKTLKILVLNGPNLDLLGTREPDVYGKETLKDIQKELAARARHMSKAAGATITLDFRQSNSESELVTWIGKTPGKFAGILLNPAAFTHTSVALLDALKAVGGPTGVPCVEVHLSNVHAREEFRHKSLTAPACIGQVMGFRATSYLLALEGLVDHILRTQKK